jgi:hypothetical protein
VPNGHNLEELFKKLDNDTKLSIDGLWDTDIRHPDKQAVIQKMRDRYNGEPKRTDLRYALKLGKLGFQELRYFYERERSFFMLSHLPYVIRRAILIRFPSWGSILPALPNTESVELIVFRTGTSTRPTSASMMIAETL